MKSPGIDICFITNSIFSSRTYWLADGQHEDVWLVDCGDAEEIIKEIPQGKTIAGVLLTHVHFDHIYGLNMLLSLYPHCRVFTNDFGKKSLMDPKRNFSRYHTDVEDFIFAFPDNVVVVAEGDRIVLHEGGNIIVHETPGHDESCLCFEIGTDLFTGDAYIPGIKTVTTFPHSDKKKAHESDLRIKSLSWGKTVHPGHTV